MDSRTEFLKILSEDYIQAKNKKEKSLILDTICLNSGKSRKYVIRTIRSRVDLRSPRKKREPAYDGEVTAALIKIWEILGYPCGQRLKPILEASLDRLVQSGKLTISDKVAGKLKKISSATIDRKLKQQRCVSHFPPAYQSRQKRVGQPVHPLRKIVPNSVTFLMIERSQVGLPV